MKIIELKTAVSTQDEVEKYIPFGEDVIVRADEQTGGKGTKGRFFISRKGGLYFSYLRFYGDLTAESAHRIIENVSVSVALALEKFGVKAFVKWPNDIIASNKKICGILSRSSVTDGVITYGVTGIGVNVNNEIDGEIADLAVSMEQILGYKPDIDEFFKTVVELLQKEHDGKLYKDLSCVLGKRISITRNGETFFSVAKDILPDGSLLLESGEKLVFGEIKII